MKFQRFMQSIFVTIFILSACVYQSHAQTGVHIQVVNLPAEFDGKELAVAGTMNEWNNSASTSIVVNDTLSFTFADIDATPLDEGWTNKPEGANIAFAIVDPGTWNRRIAGDYGSNDNNFRAALIGDTMNTIVINARYGLTELSLLMIDVGNPSVIVNGDVQLLPPIITDVTISVINLSAEFDTRSVGLIGSVAQNGDMKATVDNNTLTYLLEDVELSPLESDWQERPLDANASFVFVDPVTMERIITGDYGSNEDYFRVRLAAGMNNSVVIDASFSTESSPFTIDRLQGVSVNGNIQLPNRSIDPTMYTWPDGKWKALIMSYDDGPAADTTMINLFNSNGIVGTFNLTASFLNEPDFVTSDQIGRLYLNHEVANHSEHHPYLAQSDTVSIRNEIENCGDILKRLVGYEINGMAYPFGGAGSGAYDYRVIDIAQNLGIRYARTTNDTRSLEIPENLPDGLMQWAPTINDWDGIKFANQLIDHQDERMALLYMWGHSHFLDDAGWNKMTTICEDLGNRDDIWYAKNIEAADYLRTIYNLVRTDSSVYNPSPDISVWVVTEHGPIELVPGASIPLNASADDR